MLSIVTRGNGTAAQAYYEHLATGKDRQIEDYYAKNEQGRWVGRGAEALGLSGPVRREEFRDLAFGFDPKTGKALVRQAGGNHRSGWDLTFSAPKSVSVAWALGDNETQAKIASAHDRAVEAALSYMERHAAFCRTGHAGKDEMQADLSCAVYRHYTSREQDPQIHSHAFVFNMGMGEDGKTRTLEGSHFFEWKMAGGAAYRVALAKEMQTLGFPVLREGRSFRLKEIDRGLERVFSTRRNQIEAALEERGSSGARASEVAALTTRKAKKEKDPLLLRQEWQDRANRYERLPDREKRERSLVREDIIRSIESSREYRNVLSGVSETRSEILSEKETLVQEWARLNPPGQDRARRSSDFEERRKSLLDRWEWAREAERLDPSTLLSGLTEGNSTFTESRAHAGILQEAQGRSGLSVAEQSVEQALLDPDIVSLRKSPGRDRYTTREMLRIEQEMGEIADRLSGRSDHGVGRDRLETVLDRKPLSPEQREMVRSITRGSDLALVQGWAGTGKSYALGSAREVWEAEGYRVRGAALSGKAALGLSEGSGIASTTLASLKREMGEDGKDPLTRGDILVIDEAGMVGSRQMREVLLRAESAGAKIVLVGDTKQLPAIEAGAAFRALQERTGFVELSEIRRQDLASDR
ncbi:MAG: MobF family relaxase [Leptospirales bacterium]